MHRLPLAATPGGLRVAVRVTPRGGRDALDGVATDADGVTRLRVRVRAAPVDGAANEALLAVLADAFGVRRAAVAIESGLSGRRKGVRVAGDPASLAAALSAALARATG